MSSDDLTYYRERAAAEREAAKVSANTDIKEIHEELARLYDALIEHERLRSARMIVRPTLEIVTDRVA